MLHRENPRRAGLSGTCACAKIVERNAELGRQDAQAVQCNAGALICDLADAARADAFLSGQEHQHASIDRRAADSAPLDFTRMRLKELPERCHAGATSAKKRRSHSRPARMRSRIQGRSAGRPASRYPEIAKIIFAGEGMRGPVV
jgi:hypothetical protein